MLSSFTSENEHEKAKIHLLNVQQRRGDEKESKISEPDIQILPRKNLQNVEKDFFFWYLFPQCVIPLLLLLPGICWIHTGSEPFLRMNFFPCALFVLKYFISPSSEIGYCQSVFAKKKRTRRFHKQTSWRGLARNLTTHLINLSSSFSLASSSLFSWLQPEEWTLP